MVRHVFVHELDPRRYQLQLPLLLWPSCCLALQVNEAFDELEDGSEDALKEVLERQRVQLRWAQ